MAWSGGTFSRVHDWTSDAAAGIDILASRMDQEDDNLADGINNCIHKGGQNAATADLPMNDFRHTGVGDAESRTHYATAGGVQDGAYSWGGVATGTANAHVLTGVGGAVGFPASYPTGSKVAYQVSAAPNTGPVSLSVNGGLAKSILMNGASLVGGEFTAGQILLVIYSGTNWHVMGGGGSGTGVGFMPISCRVQATQNRTRNRGVTSPVIFDVAQWDDGTLLGTPAPFFPSNPSNLLYIPQTGRYLIMGRVIADPTSELTGTYAMRLSISVNGTVIQGSNATFLAMYNEADLGMTVRGEVFSTIEQEFEADDQISFNFTWTYKVVNGPYPFYLYGTASIGQGCWAVIRRTG